MRNQDVSGFQDVEKVHVPHVSEICCGPKSHHRHQYVMIMIFVSKQSDHSSIETWVCTSRFDQSLVIGYIIMCCEPLVVRIPPGLEVTYLGCT